MALLTRGINITNWFRYPPSADPARLDAYLTNTAMATLRKAGFNFVRLPVQPALLASPSLPRALARLRKAGLAVVVTIAADGWSLETSAADRSQLRAAWTNLAPALRGIDRTAIFPEFVNEPVFPQNPGAWTQLQAELLGSLRLAWPEATVVLTGANWGGIDGLLALPPSADANVVYSFHFYEPTVLTTLGAFEPTLDHAALAALPFPGVPGCVVPTTDARTRAVAAWYCAAGYNAAWMAGRLAQVSAWAARNNAAVLAGEFGAAATLNAPARLAWISLAQQQFTSRKFGWALWGLEDIMGFNLPRPPPAAPALDPALLHALGLVSATASRL